MNESTARSHVKPGPSRRGFLVAAGLTVAGTALATAQGRAGAEPARAPVAGAFRVPVEDVRHTRTWMAWPDSTAIWSGGSLGGVQADIALIARTIAKYEPVIMCANSASAARARSMCGSSVTVLGSIPVDGCWARDTGPVFRTDGAGGLDAVGLNFNGWGGRQTHGKDALVAERIAAYAGVPFTRAGFVGEGGAVEQDGAGTLMATRSSLLNGNRNPGMKQGDLDDAMCDAYGASEVIWFDGVYGQDITDDHVDATTLPRRGRGTRPDAARVGQRRVRQGRAPTAPRPHRVDDRHRPTDGRDETPGPGLRQDPVHRPGLPGLLRQLLPVQRRRRLRPVR